MTDNWKPSLDGYLELLNLIDNGADVDLIDAKVWCWLNGAGFKRMLKNKYPKVSPASFSCYHCGTLHKYLIPFSRQYTRSRDARRTIRPLLWTFISGGYTCKAVTLRRTFTITLPSEDLAELQAILVATALRYGLVANATG